MACSCRSFAVGRLLKEEKEAEDGENRLMEKIAVRLISVYTSGDVLELVCKCCWV